MATTTEKPLTPINPHLVKALLAWINENHQTPYIAVSANYPGTVVPQHAVKDGVIILNLSVSAIAHFQMDNHAISFRARFEGRDMAVMIPIGAVLQVFAKESGSGMIMPTMAAPAPTDEAPVQTPATSAKKRDRSFLSVVNND